MRSHPFDFPKSCNEQLRSTYNVSDGVRKQLGRLEAVKLQQHIRASSVCYAATLQEVKKVQKLNGHTDLEENPSAENQQNTHDRQTSQSPRDEIESESMILLEWPMVCRQVAAFARTSSTAQYIMQNYLPMGQSKAESSELLSQTAEAIQANLKFEGIFDLRPMVSASLEGKILNPRHLNALASTLDAAENLTSQLGMSHAGRDRSHEASTSHSPPEGSRKFDSLAKIMQVAQNGAPNVLGAIRSCIGKETDLILDQANEDLANLRQEHSAATRRLNSEIEEWARKLFQAKVSEHDRVTQQRGRQCVSVKAGRQGELPKGSIKLGSSRSGATIYMQPEPIVNLNNECLQLSDMVEEAEMEVLSQLTSEVAEYGSQLLEIADALLKIDIINARALYSDWISGVRPKFCSSDSKRGPLNLKGAQHPLLLSSCLEGLPDVPEYDETQFENNYLGSAKSLVQIEEELRQIEFDESADEIARKSSRKMPQAIDLVVPSKKKSVVLTGPNTGGKTASLKTLGLLVLMAKAGLFLPLAHPGNRYSKDQGLSRGNEVPSNVAYSEESEQSLVWFGKVLADLGDSQDLAQNLSTFSGHIRRVRQILETSESDSLVLLDELGSGTDPVEGGALAAVILEDLAPKVQLCFSTSHHAELKDLPEKDPSFMNACVEFDLESLKPTYKLLWGTPGESQALSVARGLGFEAGIIDSAFKISQESMYIQNPGRGRNEMKQSLGEEVDKAEKEAQLAHSHRKQVQKRLNTLQAQIENLKTNHNGATQKSPAPDLVSTNQRQVKQILDAFTLGSIELKAAQDQLESLRASALEQRGETSKIFGKSQSGKNKDWQPQVGETVKILSMGKFAQVSNVNGNRLSVKLGTMSVDVKKSDIVPGQSGVSDSQTKDFPSKSKSRRKRAQSSTGEANSSSVQLLRVQIEENTADLRGMRLEQAMQELENKIHECPNNSVLFVVHGHGTGQVKAAVQKHLRGHRMVKKFDFEKDSAGGCTVVEFN